MDEIILYTNRICKHCDTAKRYLEQKGYSYVEKNISKDREARTDMIKRKIRAVPSFIIGDEEVIGLDTGKIEKLINYHVINCPNCQFKNKVLKGQGNVNITCQECDDNFTLNT